MSTRTALLQDRIPGQSVMTELLEVLNADPPRSRLGRLFGADPLSLNSRPWYQGAVGEIAVGKLLTRLGPGWTVLHAVPVGDKDSDIDHVAIGPAGVFTVNTKNHEGKNVWVAERTLMVSGHKQDHIRNSIHEAARASKLLSAAAGFHVDVAGVLVLVGTKNLTTKKAASGATVLTAPKLLRWLNQGNTVLTADEVARIAAAANQPGTWHREPRDAGIPAALQDGFNRVQKSVLAARRRRRTWEYVGMATMAAGTIALINLFPNLLISIMQTFTP